MKSYDSTCRPTAGLNGVPIDWESILSEHRRWIRTVVGSRIRDANAADDVMQEVAVAVLQQTARPTDPSKVAAWLYRIALRQTVNYRRRRGRRERALLDYTRRHVPKSSPAPNPRDWILRQESRQLVATAMDNLTPRDREILLLKYTEGWSYGQLAQHLGVSVKTVEYRLLRARTALRERLQQCGEGEQ